MCTFTAASAIPHKRAMVLLGWRLPTLRQGDIVILDNLASHKVAGIKHAIDTAGAELHYLPAYSPDLNPIEQLFAKSRSCEKLPPEP